MWFSITAGLAACKARRPPASASRAPGVLWGLSYFCGVASRARASAGPLEDGRSVQSFEMSHLQSSTVDCRNDHVMQTDRIRTVGGSRTEYALLLSGAITGRLLCSPSRTSGSNTSHAAGAPSSGCLGADSGCVSGDSTLPFAVTAKLVMTRLSAAHLAEFTKCLLRPS